LVTPNIYESVWLSSFGPEIKEFIYDFENQLVWLP
jgi:hypothetical protein